MTVDLFNYPHSAGFKEHGGTSQEVARRVQKRNPKNLGARVLAIVKERGKAGMTCDECAGVMDLSILTVRPRFTELFAVDAICKTARTRVNGNGSRTRVWVAKEFFNDGQ